MIGNFNRKNRENFLPWVTDWTDPQDHIRHSNNVRDLSYTDWFYCHPSAYKLFHYGFDIIFLCVFSIIAYFVRNYYIVFVFSLIYIAYMIYSLVKKLLNYNNIKYMTFYDIHMRDFPDVRRNNGRSKRVCK